MVLMAEVDRQAAGYSREGLIKMQVKESIFWMFRPCRAEITTERFSRKHPNATLSEIRRAVKA